MVLDAIILFLPCRKFHCKKHEETWQVKGGHWSKQEQNYKMWCGQEEKNIINTICLLCYFIPIFRLL